VFLSFSSIIIYLHKETFEYFLSNTHPKNIKRGEHSNKAIILCILYKKFILQKIILIIQKKIAQNYGKGIKIYISWQINIFLATIFLAKRCEKLG
jgi:hypothetical protein